MPEMSRKAFEIAWRWLLAETILSGVLGLVLMLHPALAIFDWYDATWARAFWGVETLPAEAARQHHFALAVVGAGVVGWVVTLAFVVAGPFRRREAWAFPAVAVAVGVWVALDLVAAISFGVTGEIVFAGAAGIGFGAPLALAWPQFRRTPQQ